MDEPESSRIFQGQELPKLLLLLAITVAGWAAVWQFIIKEPDGPAEAELVVTGKPPSVQADDSLEFETVTDKTPLTFRDTAAYEKLLTRSRDATPADLAAQARRDIFYAHLWDQPRRFRGVPIHLLGTVRRVLYYESKLSRTGWLYEAYLFTTDGQNNPYVCVFEDAPEGFPVGPNVSERVIFNGYFLKLMRYEAGDVPRAAPLLIGRIGWSRPAPVDTTNRTVHWLAGGVAVMFTITTIRWILQLRRSLRPKPPASSRRATPSDQIAPEALTTWLEALHNEPDEPRATLDRDDGPS